MDNFLCVRLQLKNLKGLHARAAAKFVKASEVFQAEITVARGEYRVSGRSIMGLMMLAANCGSDIEIYAQGVDAQQALSALTDLINHKFGEDEFCVNELNP
ncbi:MAG: HPr family phosphocarrier protein [Alphaproteobacteria bacterium]|nr:HPr family phosphocarrier protein [Alphaproteobacteria bacterium]